MLLAQCECRACGEEDGHPGGSPSSVPWFRQFGAARSTTDGHGIATDGSGNVYMVGSTNGGLDANILTGDYDFYLAKYDAAGTKQFTRQLGVASANTFGNGVATDANGNVYAVGGVNGGLDGNTVTGKTDLFLIKYDAFGNRQYTKQLGVAGAITIGNAVATDFGGNVYIAGHTNGGLDGNTRTGAIDFFISKFDSSGVKQYTKQLGAAGADTEGTAIAADAGGNVYVAGFTHDGLDGNTLAGNVDFFLIKYDALGFRQYTRQMGAARANTIANGVAIDSSGNVYVAGYSNGGLNGNAATGTHDLFLAKFNSSGDTQFVVQFGMAEAHTYASGVATDAAGNVYVTGRTYVGLDGNILLGEMDCFLTKYNASGIKQYTRQLGVDSKIMIGYSVATNIGGDVFLAGYTDGDLNGNSLTGVGDAFLAKFNAEGIQQ